MLQEALEGFFEDCIEHGTPWAVLDQAGLTPRATSVVVTEPPTARQVDWLDIPVKHGSRIITDDHGGYTGLMESYRHRTVEHSVGEYVKSVHVHTNTVESLWPMFKRGFLGTYHCMPFKHLDRSAQESPGRENVREEDPLNQMVAVIRGFDGRRLRYEDLGA